MDEIWTEDLTLEWLVGLSTSATKFGKILSVSKAQFVEVSFGIWQNFEPTILNFGQICIVVPKRSNIEKIIYPSGHTGDERQEE